MQPTKTEDEPFEFLVCSRRKLNATGARRRRLKSIRAPHKRRQCLLYRLAEAIIEIMAQAPAVRLTIGEQILEAAEEDQRMNPA
jgi:hypothetical protein